MRDTTREARRIERLAKSLRLQALPNFNDSRNLKRAIKVLELAYDVRISPNGRKPMRATTLYKVTGNPSRFPTSYFQALFRTEGTYARGRAYRYRVIPHRVERLAEAIGYGDGLTKAAAKRGWTFLTPPGRRADLPRTGDRVYPWWALMRSEVRHELFIAERGQGFDYDIEAAKPTVTLQAWNRLMQAHRPDRFEMGDCRLPTWTRMVTDRTKFRADLAAEVGIDVAQAKHVVQSVLNGAWASPSPKNGIFQSLGKDATGRLIASVTYQRLRADFRLFWAELKQLDAVANLNIIKPGSTAGQVVSAFYNRIEDEIMSAVDKYFSWTAVDVWFVHDGFLCAVRISRPGLEKFILDETGYVILFEESELCKSDDLSLACRPSQSCINDLHSCGSGADPAKTFHSTPAPALADQLPPM